MVTPEAKREALKHLHERFGQSIKKICVLVNRVQHGIIIHNRIPIAYPYTVERTGR